ncbi:MAG: OmpA family protein [Labilithrix sp.]|nr:OmpA family protein [Labilithrix sp.]MCW5817280.1 OmpA family protein [Labilithrix sp.]
MDLLRTPLVLALAACIVTEPTSPSAGAAELRARALEEARVAADAREWSATLERWTDTPPAATAAEPLPAPTGGLAEAAALLAFIDARRCERARDIERVAVAQERIERARAAARDAEVSFTHGSDELSPPARVALRELAVVARSLPGARFHVAGHATEREPARRVLSEARARRVVDFLVGEGIERGRLSFAGYADTQRRSGDATDRRVELRLLPPEHDD